MSNVIHDFFNQFGLCQTTTPPLPILGPMSSADDPLKASRILCSAWTHASFFLKHVSIAHGRLAREGGGFARYEARVVDRKPIAILQVVGSIIVREWLCERWPLAVPSCDCSCASQKAGRPARGQAFRELAEPPKKIQLNGAGRDLSVMTRFPDAAEPTPFGVPAWAPGPAGRAASGELCPGRGASSGSTAAGPERPHLGIW